MSVVPSLDITHDHWDDAAGRPFAVSPAVAPPLLEGRPASQAPHVAGAGASVASLSYLEPAPPKPSLLFVGESQYEDSEKLVIQKLSMPAASARPLASAHPSLDDDDEPEDVLAITGSATDAPLGTTRVDSEEMPMPPPKPRLQLAPLERPEKPLADADDPNVDMPSSQMPMLPKPRPVPVSVSVSVATRRKSHDTAGQSTRKKARKADAEKAEADEDDEEAPAPQEVVVDGSISDEPEQSDNNSNGSGSSKSSAAASTAMGTSSTLSKLFKGFSFLLTGMGEPEPPRPPRREVTYEEPASQMTQSQAPPKRPEPVAESEVLRGEVRVLIESTGGVIVDKVPDKAKPLTLPFGQISSVILLASRPARTQKYLSALLHGVPTVRYTWLKHCLELGCIISPKPYILPAGTSLETGVDLVHTKHVPDILLDVRIELSGTPEMQRVWGELLRVAGARVLLDGLLKGRTVDVLLVARNPLGIGTWVAPEVLHQARKKGIPAVTTEWVIQCIVNQKRVPFNRPEYIFSGGADS